MNLLIESAQTGDKFEIKAYEDINQLKNEINQVTGIPIPNQVLLIGPSYKLLDTKYNPINIQPEQRIFLYDKNMWINLNNSYTNTSNTINNINSNYNNNNINHSKFPKKFFSQDKDTSNIDPIIHELTLYRQNYFEAFGENLNNLSYDLTQLENIVFNDLYEIKVKQSSLMNLSNQLTKFLSCVKVQSDAANAAVDCLKDNLDAVKQNYKPIEEKMNQRLQNQNQLIKRFDSFLEELKTVSIHPSFLEANPSAIISGISSSTSNLSSSKLQEISTKTLFDCLSIESERSYMNLCIENYSKISKRFNHVQLTVLEIDNKMKSLTIGNEFQWIENLQEIIQQESNVLIELIMEYQANYDHVIDHMTNYLQVSSDTVNETNGLRQLISDITNKRNRLQTQTLTLKVNAQCYINLPKELQSIYHIRLDHMKTHTLSDLSIKDIPFISQILDNFYNKFSQDLFNIFPRISSIQTDIRDHFKKELGWMKSFTDGDNQYIQHFTSLFEFQAHYQALLLEIQRRQQFQTFIQQQYDWFKQSIQENIVQEQHARESFMKNHGVRLPSVVFELIPSLKQKPMNFDLLDYPQQWLPDIPLPYMRDIGLEVEQINELLATTKDQLTQSMNQSIQQTIFFQQYQQTVESQQHTFQQQIEELERQTTLLKEELETANNRLQEVQELHDEIKSISSGSILKEPEHDDMETIDIENEKDHLKSLEPFTVNDPNEETSTPSQTKLKQSSTTIETSASTQQSSDSVHNKVLLQESISDLPSKQPQFNQVINNYIKEIIDNIRTNRNIIFQNQNKEDLINVLESLYKESKLRYLTMNINTNNNINSNNPSEKTDSMLFSNDLLLENLLGTFHSICGNLPRSFPLLICTQYEIGDNILCYQNPGTNYWLAFHIESKVYFLSDESLQKFRKYSKRLKLDSVLKTTKFLICNIIDINAYIATAEKNPYHLPLNTPYYVCEGQPILVRKSSDKESIPLSTSILDNSTLVP